MFDINETIYEIIIKKKKASSNTDYKITDIEDEDEEGIIKLRLLTCDHHLCVQMCFLSSDEVAGGAPVSSRVSGCQVA